MHGYNTTVAQAVIFTRTRKAARADRCETSLSAFGARLKKHWNVSVPTSIFCPTNSFGADSPDSAEKQSRFYLPNAQFVVEW